MRYEVEIKMLIDNYGIHDLEKYLEEYGTVVDFTVRPHENEFQMKPPVLIIENCPHCHEDVEVKTKKVPFKNHPDQFHIRADCNKCGRFVKFLKQRKAGVK